MSLEEDARAHVTAASLGYNVYCGPARPAAPPAMPHKAVFCLALGGFQPQLYMDGTRSSYRFMRCQIRVRGEPNSYAATRDTAASIWSHMHQASGMTGSYTRVTCDQSQPIYMGLDATQCPEFALTVLAEKRLA